MSNAHLDGMSYCCGLVVPSGTSARTTCIAPGFLPALPARCTAHKESPALGRAKGIDTATIGCRVDKSGLVVYVSVYMLICIFIQ